MNQVRGIFSRATIYLLNVNISVGKLAVHVDSTIITAITTTISTTITSINVLLLLLVPTTTCLLQQKWFLSAVVFICSVDSPALPACLPTYCLLACLLTACLPAYLLLACLPTYCLLACLLTACLPAYLLLACLPTYCLLACLPVHLTKFNHVFISSIFFTIFEPRQREVQFVKMLTTNKSIKISG